MAIRDATQAINRFKEHVAELAETWYEGDSRKAFRHAAFQQTAPDPSIADPQVIELTAIDKTGDFEIDGWFVDDTSEVFLLFQAVGGENRVDEASLTKFWDAPQEILDPERLAKTRNQSVLEVSRTLTEKLKDDYSLRMVFAAKAGFVPAARDFAKSRQRVERTLKLGDGTRIVCKCTLELLDVKELAEKYDDYRAGFRGGAIDVDLNIEERLSYPINREGLSSLRATVRASEIVRIFRMPGVGFRLFSLNPRGPIANAKVNKNIAKTLDSPQGRRTFHLLNNGLCATCDSFAPTDGGSLKVENFQIVNGCQTTVTLNSRTDAELSETLVDLKLAVADVTLAESIASASNSQTALRARDYASFERQQRQLQFEFGRLQPPWYYEIKQGYWRFVLDDSQKARFKTGPRKRHIEVQPLAQASLAFRGYPAEALDRVRFVFQGIRSPEEREWYERAFPSNVNAQQLLLPWLLLDSIERQQERFRFSTFHVLWLVASILREHYQLGLSDYFSPETSSQLCGSIQEWIPDLFRVANVACNVAYRRATNIMRQQPELRDFFRASGELCPGVTPTELLSEACKDELGIAVDTQRDPRTSLPR
ncbi:MAG: AIPR family protein [Chloroflexi bacterium]|nr:AIPR family protein [Chloroflexota bacterium]MBI4338461.1 AIPR family protein [Chloroflexota bacterium]